ncbi:MAG TPA: cytochrome c oxidase subunit II, partial [Acidimicrobiales bacterium]|nr:cytochrome c oxidase subunit II [Acidimicrobiales bacterium]
MPPREPSRPIAADPTPLRSGSSKRRRIGVVVALVFGALVLGGCRVPTFGAFRGATVQGHDEFKLWFGMMVAGLVVAVIVWLLIFWSILAYRRKKGDTSIPRQFHTHIPIEIIYTVIPIIIVFVIFGFTVVTENSIDAVPKPAEQVHVNAFRWGWTFTYMSSTGRPQGVVIKTAAEPVALAQPPVSSEYPQLVLPLGERTEIVLTSTDVAHSFYVPAFNFSRMALPGHTNLFEFTPTVTGVFDGQCNQFCGLYHSEMLFSVRVVTKAKFAAWL